MLRPVVVRVVHRSDTGEPAHCSLTGVAVYVMSVAFPSPFRIVEEVSPYKTNSLKSRVVTQYRPDTGVRAK